MNDLYDPNLDVDDDDDDVGADPDPLDLELARYRQEMEAMGAEFDDDGNFVGYKQSGIQTPNDTPPVQTPAPKGEDVSTQVRQEIQSALRPTMLKSTVDNIVTQNPKLANYRGMVEQAIANDPNFVVNDATVKGLFYFFRGQAADVEIAKAVKEKEQGATRVDLAGAAASESGAPRTTGTPKNADVTDEIASYAKAWGIDAQKLANKLRDEKARKK